MLLHNVDVLIFCHSIISIRRAGPHRIATEIRNNGYTCQLIDASWYFDQNEIQLILNTCIGPNTKIVAWSSPYAPDVAREQLGSGIRETIAVQHHEQFIISYTKSINAQIKFVVGGPNAHVRLTEPGIDTIFHGMSDVAIVEYLKFLQGRNPFFQYEVEHGKMIVSGDRYNAKWNFSDSAIEYRPEDNLFHGDSVPIEISRGCIFKCDFCSFPLNGKKNNEYIKYQQILQKEFLVNYHEHGIQSYIVSDDTFNDNLVKLQMMADIAQSLPFELSINCYIRIDLVRAHPEQYSLFKDIGLSGAFFGIESFNHASAKSIGKGLHPDKVIEELYKFNDLLPHCGTTGSFIVGLPHETIETVARQKEQLLDPAFPIDNILMYPLTLDHSRKHNLSEFEKNTAKYFKIRSSDPGWWHNGHFDVDWAKNFCRTFFDHSPERNRVGGFQVATLQNYYPNQKIVGVPNYTVAPTLTQQQNKLAEYKFRLFSNG